MSHAAPNSAQETAPLEGWEELADSRPFPTARLTIPKWRLSSGPHVRSAFREVIAEARQATVRVRNDGRDTALGGIVGADGWVLTKASRLPGKITCLLADQREFDARIVGVNRDYDLALLKIDAQRLTTLQLKTSPTPDIGAWLATVGLKRGPQAVGVLSVGPREISHRAGTLGVHLDRHTDVPLIIQVFPHTGAAEAGLQSNDLVLSINQRPTPTREDFVRRIREHSPGDLLKLQVRRGDETLDITALLQSRRPWRLPTREEFQNQLGSSLSQRRFGFPSAFQHDTVIKPSDCGG
ncbi:MAG: serine protease, partial [Planctomycetes bacterium]|nr:serine protease [Planctomycetota bacterium]